MAFSRFGREWGLLAIFTRFSLIAIHDVYGVNNNECKAISELNYKL